MSSSSHGKSLSLLLLLLSPLLATSYTFSMDDPTSCGDLNFSVDGGKPPYRALIVPAGPNPINVEVRYIIDHEFDGSSSSVQLKYPAQSQFFVTMSDADGFGTGGVTGIVTVQNGGDTSCVPNEGSEAAFVFNIDPSDLLNQCQATRLWWDPAAAEGDVTVKAMIPGGQAWEVPADDLTTEANKGIGFSFTIPVRGGTLLALVAGDNRGWGSAGSIVTTVGNGINPNNTCINDESPSSTPGSPAGGAYPTEVGNADESNGNGGGSKSGPNIGAIVGGVVGGIAALVLLALFFFFCFRKKRSRKENEEKRRRVDLLQEDDEEASGPANELPHYYRPEPFIAPEPTEAGSSSHGGRPMTEVMSERSESPVPSTSAGTSTTRKSAGPRTMRPVNFVQHEDAGPPPKEEDEEAAETVELPPAYTNIRGTTPQAPVA
ncbi:hypothetical protein BDV98DRAFT_582164 [Pterulicium gracile]|uniref:Epidermal growth factor receptor-like transmembrane-juxtamembrane segment domain-containing protein n=1 Tax=Pterulicium gracile TaxID=1884261 RepID=A0A5C3QW68_9AGAR|nr:hypothetical protein BDV98DRAFT_582164 [Pterula gracilis]